MTLNLINLDEITRANMVSEIELDIAHDDVYLSKYLTPKGQLLWSNVLLEAAEMYDTTWLGTQLVHQGLATNQIYTIDKNGSQRRVNLPQQDLANSEFNRYYIRAMCVRAIDENVPNVITYRAKPVQKPKSRIGLLVNPSDLLNDLRSNKEQTRLGIPSNPRSGISVRLP